MSPLLAALLAPTALCSRLVRRRPPRPDRTAQVPLMYAGRPDFPQRVITTQWRKQP